MRVYSYDCKDVEYLYSVYSPNCSFHGWFMFFLLANSRALQPRLVRQSQVQCWDSLKFPCSRPGASEETNDCGFSVFFCPSSSQEISSQLLLFAIFNAIIIITIMIVLVISLFYYYYPQRNIMAIIYYTCFLCVPLRSMVFMLMTCFSVLLLL